eukprot:3684562-Amphidinium_carterae.1
MKLAQNLSSSRPLIKLAIPMLATMLLETLSNLSLIPLESGISLHVELCLSLLYCPLIWQMRHPVPTESGLFS